MDVLLHICCAPCTIAPLKALRGEGHAVTGFFHNPNIHPFIEFRKRIKAVRVFMETDPIPVEIDETYGLDEFVRRAYDPVAAARCEKCYSMRLLRTAERARGRFGAFTTTLLVSKEQDHERVRAVGERVAEETGVPFLYRDWRPLRDEGHAEAKRRSLYRQAYCGCCWSEWERYKDTTKELYRGPGGPRDGKGG